MTKRTSGLSMPMPNAIVATITLISLRCHFCWIMDLSFGETMECNGEPRCPAGSNRSRRFALSLAKQ